MGVTVEELLDVPFFSRTREEKLTIVQEGKPRPPFTLSVVTVRQSNGQVVQAQHYDQGLYDLLPWLTRCDKRRSFFCWPCLLFMTGKQWSETGVPDGQFLVGGVYDHEVSAEHIQAMLDWRMFIKNYVIPKKGDPETLRIKQIENIKKNREIFKRIIDSVCDVVMRAQPVKKNGYFNRIKKKDCVSVLQFIRNYDIQFTRYIDEAICLLNVNPNFIDDVVNALTSVVKSAVKKEAHLSTYVSIIISEHSEISSRSQISTILRYIKSGRVCERFVGFINIPRSRQADVGLQTYRKAVEEFDLKERFLSYAVDGAVLHPTKVHDLHCMLKSEFPFSFFAPHQGHGLDAVLQQSVSHIKECGVLFRTLNEIGIFFQKNSHQYKSLEKFMFLKMPYLENTKWFKRSQLVKVLNTYRKYFIEYFMAVEEDSREFEAEDLVKMHGFRLCLEEFETAFLIRVMSRIFELTTYVNAAMKSSTPENAFEFAGIQQLIRNLKKEQETGFEKMWLHIVVENMKEKEDDYATNRKRKTYHFRDLFNKIMGIVIQEVENRLCHLTELEFCHLLVDDKCNERTRKRYIERLMAAHKPYFDKEQVEVEYVVLKNNGYAEKSVHELLDFITKVNLKSAFPYLTKLAELILTLPIRKVPHGQSKLKQIEKVSYTAYEDDEVIGDASVLFIEKEFLQELKKTNNFHDEVFNVFNELSRYIDLS